MKQIIMGIDPGTIRTGFAILARESENIKLLKFGVLSASPKQTLEQRLVTIGQDLETLYQQYSPKETAIEKIFFGKNADSAFKLGHLFGLCLYQATLYNSSIFQYAARFIKQSITGSGRADKDSVKAFVYNIFHIQDRETNNNTDATDAIAVALCHVYQKQQHPSIMANNLKSG